MVMMLAPKKSRWRPPSGGTGKTRCRGLGAWRQQTARKHRQYARRQSAVNQTHWGPQDCSVVLQRLWVR